MTNDNKFSEDLTYEEWESKQDKNGLEFKIIQNIHEIFPSWSVDEVREYAPKFISSYTKMVRDIQRDNPEYNMIEIRQEIYDAVTTFKNSRKSRIEIFGEGSADDRKVMDRWISGINHIMRIILSRSKYKYEDIKGHSYPEVSKLAGKTIGFRAELQLSRDIGKIMEHYEERFETKSDFFREAIFKFTEIYSMIYADGLGIDSKKILKNAKDYRVLGEKSAKDDKIAEIDSSIDTYYDELDDILGREDYDKSLDEFRDDIVEYIRETLLEPGKVQFREKIRDIIMKNRKLEKILRELEKEKLVSKEYVDSITEKGIVIQHLPDNVNVKLYKPEKQ